MSYASMRHAAADVSCHAAMKHAGLCGILKIKVSLVSFYFAFRPACTVF